MVNTIDYFDRGWTLDPAAPCLVQADGGASLSYDHVRAITLRAANALRARGFGVGAKAAVLSPNDAVAYAVVLAVMRAGAIWVPINPRNALAENARILDRFDCDILFFHSAFAAAVPEIRRAAPNIRAAVCIDDASGDAPSLDDWTAAVPADEIELPHEPERPYMLIPSGGTTGFPKGILLPVRNLENIVANFLAVAPGPARPVFLGAAPMTHAAGHIAPYILCQGGAVVILPAPDRLAILEAIPKFGVTHTFLPPTVIYDLLNHPRVRDFDYSSLRYLMYGASPMAPEKLREAIATFGPVMTQIYGQIEAAVPCLYLAPEDHLVDGKPAPAERLASCGRATPFTRVAIMDDDGRLLPPGAVGEIVVRSQGVMLGYYKDPELTAAVSGFGWHHTGDIAYRDAQGFHYIVDRKTDMIISGGFNVYSTEVERAVLAHPAVKECAVVGVPDPKWGEAVKAVVELRDGRAASADEIIALCRERIGPVKSPKSVDFVDALPRSPAGKVLKREVRRRYWDKAKRMVS